MKSWLVKMIMKKTFILIQVLKIPSECRKLELSVVIPVWFRSAQAKKKKKSVDAVWVQAESVRVLRCFPPTLHLSRPNHICARTRLWENTPQRNIKASKYRPTNIYTLYTNYDTKYIISERNYNLDCTNRLLYVSFYYLFICFIYWIVIDSVIAIKAVKLYIFS